MNSARREFPRYAVAMAAVVAAFLLREALTLLTGPGLPTYVTFYPAVMLVAMRFGFGPGLASTLATALLVVYWYLPPLWSFGAENLVNTVGLALFTGTGVFLSTVAELYLRARRKLEEHVPDRTLLKTADAAGKPVREKWFLVAGATVSFIVLSAVAWQSYDSITSEHGADRDVIHSFIVSQELDRLLAALADLEAGQRGYLITGKETYLSHHDDARERTTRSLAVLVELAGDDPNQRQRVAGIEPLVREKIAVVTSIIELQRTRGAEAARKAMSRDRGHAIMERIRTLVAEAQAEESRQYGQRAALKEENSRRTVWLLVSGTTLSFLLLMAVLYFLSQENARRRRVEQDLHLHRDRLEETVLSRTAELNAINERLTAEIGERLRAEESLRRLNDDLEQRVLEQTGEIRKTSESLEARVEARTAELLAANEDLRASRRAALNLMDDALHARQGAEHSARRLAILSETAGALLASDQPQRLVNSLCRAVMEHLDCQVFFNFLVDENTQRLHLNAFAGIPEVEAKRIEWLDFGTTLCGCVARDGERIVAERIPASPDERTDRVRSYGIKAYCCHPLLGAGGKVLGTLSFGTRNRETFDEADISLMQAVSDQVAVAMMRMKSEQALRESSDRYRSYIEVTGQLGWTTDPKGKVVEDIPSWRAYTGQTYDEIKEWGWGQALHPDDLERTTRAWRETVASKRPYEAEYRIRRYDGIYQHFIARGIPLLNDDGSVREWVGTCIDITERKLAEEALKKAHAELELRVEERTRELSVANESVRTERQRLFSVLETLPVYVILLDADHRIPFANRFFRERFGASNGRRCYEYLFSRTEPCEICETYTVLKTNAPHHWYWTGPDKRDYDIYDYPFVDSDGATLILEMGIDITDQKKAQQALRETITELKEATHRAELTNSLLSLITQKNARREYLDATCDLLQSWSGVRHVGVRVTDPARKIPFESCKGYNTGFLEQENDLSLAEDQCICTRIIAGTPEPSDLRSMTPKGSFYSGDALAFVDRLTENERSRYRGVCMKHQYRSLAVIPILYRGNPAGAVHLADERPEMLSRTTIEFLEQLAQIIGEAVYRFGVEEERVRLTSALESSADGVVITNSKNGQIEYVNRAFEQITGYAKNEAIGSNLHLLDSGKQDEAFYRELRASLARNGVWRGVLINRKKDGMLYYEECSFSPVLGSDGSIVNYVSVKRDVTEKLRLESIAESVTSMNNIGYIFAGVRHEIGNPINSAKMMLSVLQMKLETATTEAIKNYVDRSLVEIGRVENLLRNLKNFNLYETPELKDLHLPSFLREFRNLVAEDLKQKGIAFKQNIPESIERARIDPRALQQVLINLVTNAADAVAGEKDPSIEINIRRESGLLHIEVTDNGAGLTEKQQQDLFKPFYTSKVHGTGLGLVIVKKLLTRMNCGISVTSIPGEGTIVDITVPEGSS